MHSRKTNKNTPVEQYISHCFDQRKMSGPDPSTGDLGTSKMVAVDHRESYDTKFLRPFVEHLGSGHPDHQYGTARKKHVCVRLMVMRWRGSMEKMQMQVSWAT